MAGAGSKAKKVNVKLIGKLKDLGVSVEEVSKKNHLKYRLSHGGKEAFITFASTTTHDKYEYDMRSKIADILYKDFDFDRNETKKALRLILGTERELTAKQQAALEWWRSELERSADDRLSDAEIVKRDARNARRRELYRMRKVDAGSR